MAEIRHLITLERRNMPDGLTDEQKAEYRVPIEADADLFRYATYGLDGIIKDFGDEFGYTAIGQNFTVKSGKAAINGRTAVVPSSGKTFAVGTSATNTYWLVYIEINMSRTSSETAELIAVSQVGAYPTIQPGEDLTINPTGIARRELYRFTATSGVIGNVQKTTNILAYSSMRPDFSMLINSEATKIDKIEEVSVSKILQINQGWYRIEMSGGGGSGGFGGSSNSGPTGSSAGIGGRGGAGGSGGKVTFNVNIPFTCYANITIGGGGSGSPSPGASGGKTIFLINNLGINAIATGGGRGGIGGTGNPTGTTGSAGYAGLTADGFDNAPGGAGGSGSTPPLAVANGGDGGYGGNGIDNIHYNKLAGSAGGAGGDGALGVGTGVRLGSPGTSGVSGYCIIYKLTF